MAGMKSKILHPDAWLLTTLILLLLPLVALNPVAATGGSFQLSVQGYGTVNGQLENPIIEPNNSVSMIMLLNDQLQTSQGTYPISATGVWNGVLNGSTLSGKIQNVSGKVKICVLCPDANFVGEGHWTGSLNITHATGTFDGTITFTNSPFPQIPVGQPVPVDGTWAADFQQTIPEFRAQSGIYILLLAATTLVLMARRIPAQNV